MVVAPGARDVERPSADLTIPIGKQAFQATVQAEAQRVGVPLHPWATWAEPRLFANRPSTFFVRGIFGSTTLTFQDAALAICPFPAL
jgi:hypothetical protein